MKPREYNVTASQVAEGFGYSYWLKDAVKAAHGRDIVDALRDAEILASILRKELSALNAAESADCYAKPSIIGTEDK